MLQTMSSASTSPVLSNNHTFEQQQQRDDDDDEGLEADVPLMTLKLAAAVTNTDTDVTQPLYIDVGETSATPINNNGHHQHVDATIIVNEQTDDDNPQQPLMRRCSTAIGAVASMIQVDSVVDVAHTRETSATQLHDNEDSKTAAPNTAVSTTVAVPTTTAASDSVESSPLSTSLNETSTLLVVSSPPCTSSGLGDSGTSTYSSCSRFGKRVGSQGNGQSPSGSFGGARKAMFHLPPRRAISNVSKHVLLKANKALVGQHHSSTGRGVLESSDATPPSGTSSERTVDTPTMVNPSPRTVLFGGVGQGVMLTSSDGGTHMKILKKTISTPDYYARFANVHGGNEGHRQLKPPNTLPTSVTLSQSTYGSTVVIDQTAETRSFASLDTPDIGHDGYEYPENESITLMYAKHEKIPMKDFGSEVRATMDIDHLLNKSVLLLDLQETSLEEIFAKIIHEMDIQEPEFTAEQVRSALFTQDSGNQFHILSRTVQSICTTGTAGGTFDYDQTWICALCMLSTVQHRHVAIARLSHPTNLGRTMQDLRFIIIVIAPSRAKGTKTALETARTFATLFADMDIRQRLVMAQSVDQFRHCLLQAAKELAIEQTHQKNRKNSTPGFDLGELIVKDIFGVDWHVGRGLKQDFNRRSKHYITDYLDGITGHKTKQKLFSSVVFLYFACLLPAIAFGVLNHDNTDGHINVEKVIFAQAIGGIFFAIFGGQPMIIILTTAPLAIYMKVIYRISLRLNENFYSMYACTGLWCQFFLVIYAFTELSNVMRYATRSSEEVFSLFIGFAFVVESFKAMFHNFQDYYNADECIANSQSVHVRDWAHLAETNQTANLSALISQSSCRRDTSILYILLMFGTLWLGLFLYNFRKTPFLTRARREILADYALPVSVLFMSFLGYYAFSEVRKDRFEHSIAEPKVQFADLTILSWQSWLACAGLGFSLSFLFFMDQNITSAIVNNPQNKLKKGTATHLDLLVVAVLNCILSLLGLPWMHGSLPHSPLHLRALADVEERVAQGHVHEVITNVRETRLASLITHLLILGSCFVLLPVPLQNIPTSVLHGVFLYMAATSLGGNEMFERMLLLITEQQAYPPTHYIRKVPQRKVHLFTVCQLLQLGVLCACGFAPSPFLEMIFPIVCFLFLPIRHMVIPKLISKQYLDALDGKHVKVT